MRGSFSPCPALLAGLHPLAPLHSTPQPRTSGLDLSGDPFVEHEVFPEHSERILPHLRTGKHSSGALTAKFKSGWSMRVWIFTPRYNLPHRTIRQEADPQYHVLGK